MKNLWPVLLLAGGLFLWSRSCDNPLKQLRVAGLPGSTGAAVDPVHQMEHQPDAMMQRENALPGPAGLSAGAMVGSVQRSLGGQH